MKNNTKITMTVAIPAYNEERNIRNILTQLLKQSREKYTLRKILVYSDGSNDKTVSIVKNISKHSQLIKLVEYKKQRGKIYRLDSIFRKNVDDVLVLLDADIVLVDDKFLDNLIEPIISDSSVQMVAAHQILVRPENFAGKVIYSIFLLWDYVRWSVPNKDHVQNYYETATAFRGSFARKLHIPEGATDSRMYVYLMAKKDNGFRYADNAKLLYRTASSFKQYIQMADRPFGSPQPALEKYFGRPIMADYIIPRKYVIAGIVKSFYRQPIYTPVAIISGYIFNKLSVYKSKRKSTKWEISTTSKQYIGRKEIKKYAV
jgi:glycosyltransferase involved in cell wall biosynthesis